MADDRARAERLNLVHVLFALVVLLGLVALIFLGLPNWVGSSNVTINVRPP